MQRLGSAETLELVFALNLINPGGIVEVPADELEHAAVEVSCGCQPGSRPILLGRWRIVGRGRGGPSQT